MDTEAKAMNTIGIDRNLDRARIRKLLAIGLFASILTGIGDFLLGYAEQAPAAGMATGIMAGAAKCPVKREIPEKVRKELDEYLNRKRKGDE